MNKICIICWNDVGIIYLRSKFNFFFIVNNVVCCFVVNCVIYNSFNEILVLKDYNINL